MISVIIPVSNEAARLPATLASLAAQSVPHEVVVVDAGSQDETAHIARGAGARVLQSRQRQRAAQMNLGAGAAQGSTLLFLHGDTRLPAGALECIDNALASSAVAGGGFARRYDSASPFLRFTCALAELRTRAGGWFLGDQAIFVRHAAFTRLAGFRDLDLFEDLDFARRLKGEGRLVTLRPPVVSAGRRFTARGAFRTTWSDLGLTVRYLLHGSRPSVSPFAARKLEAVAG